MKGYDAEEFGKRYAERYDGLYGEAMADETNLSVETLAELANGGKVLEFAIGTGRVALPLAAKGLEVHGIEASEEMVAKLREKPGGQDIPVAIGDMSKTQVDGKFDLIYLVFNTIFNLTTQEAQVRCFQNASKHLSNSGVFVIETVLPDFSTYVEGQRMRGSWNTMEASRFEIAIQDQVEQTVAFQRIIISEDGIKMNPHFMRYAWPSELDLMAQIADLKRRERWAWWDKTPFTTESKSHISVYGRASK